MLTEPFVIDVSVTFDLNDFQYFMYGVMADACCF